MLVTGSIVDRYQVESLLAEGGMGVVYRVRHTTLHSQHALKVVPVPRRSLMERLVREGQLQAAFRHPNVVPVTDVILLDGQPALVMDFVDGPSLQALLDERRLTVSEIDSLMRGVLAGVAEAHARGLVHRDIKPSNVLLSRTAEGSWFPRVTDFGIAKVVQDGHTGTRSGIAMGTPGYMAPEQFRSARQVDARADVYSLGCLLYHLICGRPAFTGNLFEIVNKVAQGAWEDPRRLGARLSPELEALLRRCMAFAPGDRFRDAGAVLAAWPGIDPDQTVLPNGHFSIGDPASDAPAGATADVPPTEAPATAPAPATAGTGVDDPEAARRRAPSAETFDGSLLPVGPRRSFWSVAAAVAALCALGALLGVGAVLWIGRAPPSPAGPQPSAGPQRAPIPPQEAAVTEAAAPLEEAAPIEAPAASPTAAAPEGGAPRSPRPPAKELPPAGAVRPEEPPPKADNQSTKTGRLRISAAPASEVTLYLDGAALGAHRFDGRVSTGRHKVKLVHQGQAFERSVEVPAEGTATVCYDFDREMDCS